MEGVGGSNIRFLDLLQCPLTLHQIRVLGETLGAIFAFVRAIFARQAQFHR